MAPRKEHTKKGSYWLRKLIFLALFIGCSLFVLYRGYKSFNKYLSRPQSVEEKYQFVNNLPFPTISFCPVRDSPPPYKPDGFKPDILEKCNMTKEDYITGKFHQSQSNSNDSECSDPEELIQALVTSWTEFGILSTQIKTRKTGKGGHELNQDNWKAVMSMEGQCFTLELNEEIMSEGIEEIQIKSQRWTRLTGQIHMRGARTSKIPISYPEVALKSGFYAGLAVSYEVSTKLDFDGLECNSDPVYDFDNCRSNYIQKVYEFS